MNELTAVGPENQSYARRFGGQTPLIHTLATDLFPVTSSDFGTMDPELLALAGARMRASQILVGTATVGEFTAVGIANPANSGVLGVLEMVMLFPGAAAQSIEIRRQAAAVSASQGSAQGVPLDSRITESASIRLLASDEAALANYGTRLGFLQMATAQSVELPEIPYVLAPNSTLWFCGQAANVGITAWMIWRQRKIEDGELTPV